MNTILNRIIEHKKSEVAQRKAATPAGKLELSPFFSRPAVSLRESLLSENASGIIAEFKRMSPSAGWINRGGDPVEITRGYVEAGASAVSVLTDREFFSGMRDDLMKAREVNDCPLLRKDFMIDPYQVIEAKALGADVILLIAAVLENTKIREMAKLARELGMEVLMEVHDAHELGFLNDWIDVVGVNNRDLKKMKTDVRASVGLAKMIPDGYLKISESGIDKPDTIKRLKGLGYQGFLIGEFFMRQEDPAMACKEFIDKIT